MGIVTCGITTHGRSVVLSVTDDGGRVGRGEASPLEGYSPDSFETCAAALSSLALEDLDLDGADPRSILASASARLDVALPAARCAVETAVLDLLGLRRGEPAWRLLTDEPPASARVAALVADENPMRWPELARAARQRGRCAVKIKVGRSGALAREMEILPAVRRAIGSDVALRLDANGGLSVEDASLLLRAAERVEVDLFEEPVPFPELGRLDPGRTPLALDESLQRVDPRDAEVWRIADEAGVRALVLKPTALGGIVRCLDLAAWAAPREIRVVITHTFDGPVALTAAAALALAVNDEVHGLDLHPGLRAWPNGPLPITGDGTIRAWDSPGLGFAEAGR